MKIFGLLRALNLIELGSRFNLNSILLAVIVYFSVVGDVGGRCKNVGDTFAASEIASQLRTRRGIAVSDVNNHSLSAESSFPDVGENIHVNKHS